MRLTRTSTLGLPEGIRDGRQHHVALPAGQSAPFEVIAADFRP